MTETKSAHPLVIWMTRINADVAELKRENAYLKRRLADIDQACRAAAEAPDVVALPNGATPVYATDRVRSLTR